MRTVLDFPTRMKSVTAIGLAGIVALAGCAAMNERRWDGCAIAGGLIGAAVGAGTAGGLVNAYEGGHGGNAEETGAAAGGGAVVGAALGTLLGHLICDPKEAPPPPPPPPSPPPPPPPPAPKKISLSADTYFDFDKATLKPAGKEKIDEEIVPPMKEHSNLRALVEGHTDSIGSDAYNQRLSERRADAVRDYMVSRGIDAQRITTKGYGKSEPIASNKTKEGRAQNRRVEVTEE